jgi:hypothetical protein
MPLLLVEILLLFNPTQVKINIELKIINTVMQTNNAV